jgi:hypothetical protein
MAMRAKTAAVEVEAPETAANPAVAKTVATARPPGTQPSHLRAASNSDSVMPAWKARKPTRMNIGSTLSV